MRSKIVGPTIVLILALALMGVANATCPGCCSGHSGVRYACAANGHVYCNDGTVSASCSCASCSIPNPPTCPTGQSWNGYACVMPDCAGGRTMVNGLCECPSGQIWASVEKTCHTPAAATACGVERWDIKTGGDPGARAVSNFPQATWMAFLLTLHAPADVSLPTRIDPVENSTYVFNAELIEYRRTEDSDYHLILVESEGIQVAGPYSPMVVKIPHPDCVSASSPFLEDIKAARSAFDRAFAATSTFKTTSTPVRVSGVGFWGIPRSQQFGAARNGIEIQPVRSFIANPSSPLAIVPLDGLWVIDSEITGSSGRGFQLETHNGITVMTYYGYRTSGESQWYLAAGPLTNNDVMVGTATAGLRYGQFTGMMESYEGGTAFGANFVSAAKVGSIDEVTLQFSSATKGVIALPREPSRAISKFNFFGGAVPSVSPLNGLWAIDSERNGQPGRGFQIEERGGLLVLTFYGYSASGSASWHLASGRMNGNTFTGELVDYRGGTVLGGAYMPATPSGSAGTVVVTFTSNAKGTITLPGEPPKAISKFSW